MRTIFFIFYLCSHKKSISLRFYVNFMGYTYVSIVFSHCISSTENPNVGKHSARSNSTFHEMKLSQKYISTEKLERDLHIEKLKLTAPFVAELVRSN